MRKVFLPGPEYLRERLDYDPDTGTLRWRRSSLAPNNWNARWAGKEAFTTINNGYRQGAIDGNLTFAHRLIWIMVYGEPAQGVIRHINGDRGDNRLCNLTTKEAS